MTDRREWDVLELQLHPNNYVIAEEAFDNLECLARKSNEAAEEKQKPKESAQSAS